jgi:DegV family protein with EDD domain
MPGIRVVTDSACDLPEEVAARHRIPVVPLSIRFGAEELTEVGAKDFWVKCHQSSVLPATAAPSPGAFVEAFRQMAAEGADAVACINLSSKLSATIESARTAARQLEGEVNVEVIDSTSVSLGQGLLVLGAARLAEEGKSLAEVAAYVAGAAARLKVYGVLDTLENLKKGGRIGGAQALLGSMLAIKPVIEIRDGEVHEESKQRTRGRSLQYLANKVTEEARAGRVPELGIMHGDASDIDKFVDMVASDVPRDHMLVGLVGAVIGTHGGPGVVGVAWIEPS